MERPGEFVMVLLTVLLYIYIWLIRPHVPRHIYLQSNLIVKTQEKRTKFIHGQIWVLNSNLNCSSVYSADRCMLGG